MAELSAVEGDTARAIRELVEGLRLAQRSRTITTMGVVGHQLPRLYLQAGGGDRRSIRLARRAIAMNRRLIERKNRLELRPLTLMAEGLVAEAEGDRAVADAKLSLAERNARALGMRFYEYDIITQRGRVLADRGDRDGARRSYEVALALATHCQDRLFQLRCEAALGSL